MKNPTIDSLFERCAPITESGCWIWMGAISSKTGYGYWRFGKLAHRIMYQVAYGEFDPRLFVLHRCDTRCCINPSHLFLGTAKDNSADMVSKGRSQKGESASGVKLKSEQVVEIRASRGMLTQKEIASKY